jgi:N-sulfoglucosamine sulfohydrolase
MNKVIFAIFALLVGCTVSSAAEKPNLLIITADDLNGDSMGWMGGKVGATPNLDKFAATCQRFEHFYTTAPICQPSREAFMTGRVPHRSGALGFNPIRLDVPTLPEVLKSNGWFIAAINKTAHMQPAEKFPWDFRSDGSGKSPKVLREQFERCLKAAADAKRPFFINANITDPHRPFPSGNPAAKGGKKQQDADAAPVKMFSPDEIVVPPMLEDLPEVRREMAQYFSAVRRLDETFAGLIAALKAAGQDTNTIIVFFSDNGISAPFSKATLFKCGTWSPMLLRWPGQAKPAFNRADMIGGVDLMPTALELLGVAPPPGMDGRSFVPLLKGRKQDGRDHVFTWVNTVVTGKSFPSRCVRTKTRAYIWNEWPDGKTEYKVEGMSGLTFKTFQAAGATNSNIKARVDHYLYRCAEEFYDLEKDPTERKNLINDPKRQGEIQRMKKLLLAEMEHTGDPLLSKFRGATK